MDRKEFLKASCGVCVALIGASAFLESCKKSNNATPQGPTSNFTIDLSNSSYSSLNAAGGQTSLNGVVVARTGSSYIAVAQSCTHQGCSVSFNGNNQFVCPCHNGVFDINGNVVSGPPPSPIKKYTVSQSGNILTITG